MILLNPSVDATARFVIEVGSFVDSLQMAPKDQVFLNNILRNLTSLNKSDFPPSKVLPSEGKYLWVCVNMFLGSTL